MNGPFLMECQHCTPSSPVVDRLCQQCFKVWYDSGITEYGRLSLEMRLRKEKDAWPFGPNDLTYARIKALDAEWVAIKSEFSSTATQEKPE